ncbi:unnamed protein product [Blepharisma stoltei]|uniref:Tetrapyrrole methylase domain-containing protein n=1 Tax=Blepharisma stoltei TaxID=1481888 RepID=A0AAU9JIE4_9CILI|nr:unnamed protein product [Blepharisma stoltei]
MEKVNIPTSPSRGMLTICPTPIGNLDDIAIRQYQAIKAADIIASEDNNLASHLVQSLLQYDFSSIKNTEFPPQDISNLPNADDSASDAHKDWSAVSMVRKFKAESGRALLVSLKATNAYSNPQLKLIRAMKSGVKVVLLAPSGSLLTGASLKLVSDSIKEGVSLEALPGPAAAIVAVCSSGFPADNFWFVDYLPDLLFERNLRLETLKKSESTVVFYEKADKIVKTVEQINKIYGINRFMVIGQNLTRENEKVFRGTGVKLLQELKEYTSQSENKSDFVVVISPFISKAEKEVFEVKLTHIISTLRSKLSITEKNLAFLVEKMTGVSRVRALKILNKLEK